MTFKSTHKQKKGNEIIYLHNNGFEIKTIQVKSIIEDQEITLQMYY